VDTRLNNFDLIRLLAATQVVVFHSVAHLGLDLVGDNPLVVFFQALPGVPIFFFISGFVVSLAWERSRSVSHYGKNRFLRIYPALWMCSIIAFGSAIIIGDIHPPIEQLVPWLLAQFSIGQFYNPEFLRSYGVGVLNGSLWTIPVELQFYIALPLLYPLFAESQSNAKLIALIILFLAFNQLGLYFKTSGYENLFWTKLYHITVIPYMYMFLIGVLLQRNIQRLRSFLERRFLLWLLIFICAVFTAKWAGLRVGTNGPNPFLVVIMDLFIASAAFSFPKLSDRLLRRNDLSYGVYLYHMVIVNVVIELGIAHQTGFWIVMLGTFLLAWLSWRQIERPAMRLKKRSIHPQMATD